MADPVGFVPTQDFLESLAGVMQRGPIDGVLNSPDRRPLSFADGHLYLGAGFRQR